MKVNKDEIEDCKKVPTFDQKGEENGFLIELFKKGNKTLLYLSAVKTGGFKGYHLHRIRSATYVCIKGKMKIILYLRDGGRYVRKEYILDANKPQRLFVPPLVPTGLQNIASEESWLINYPDPPYDPALLDEQIEYTQEELDKGVVK